jgi:hypothetical protein
MESAVFRRAERATVQRWLGPMARVSHTVFASCAVLQASAAHGLSHLFSGIHGNYAMLLMIGATSLVLALAADLPASSRTQ